MVSPCEGSYLRMSSVTLVHQALASYRPLFHKSDMQGEA